MTGLVDAPHLFDAHCHLDLVEEAAPSELLADARRAGVAGLVIPGVHPRHAPRQARLCEAEQGLAWTAGLHPWWVEDSDPDAALDELGGALDRDWPVAPCGLGELGLDHLRADDDHARQRQRRSFRAQLALARDRDLPVVLHVVKAHGAVLEILRQDGVPDAGGMVHGFSGAAQLARQYLDLGLHISVGHGVLRGGWKRLKSAVPVLPGERLLVETDAPDGCPRPADVAQVVAAVADLREEDPEQVARSTADNAIRLFGLSSPADSSSAAPRASSPGREA